MRLILGDCPARQFCDFEDFDICGYQNDVTAKLRWGRDKGQASFLNTGPSFDHTYQTKQGYYMYIFSVASNNEGNMKK